jgi:protein-tyrosine-phosphatase
MRSIFLSSCLVLFLIIGFSMTDKSNTSFTPKLKNYCDSITKEFDQISKTRKETLAEIIAYTKNKLKGNNNAQLMFICTHNSRRSQFGQVWAATAAKYYGIKGIKTYSGGIEVTACNSRTIETMKRVGFLAENKGGGINPQYQVKAAKSNIGNTLFSKLYSDFHNPRSNFVAILVCSDADEKCPLVQGAEERVSLPYKDPKAFDNTLQEAEKYDERCRQIAREIFYVFSQLNQ